MEGSCHGVNEVLLCFAGYESQQNASQRQVFEQEVSRAGDVTASGSELLPDEISHRYNAGNKIGGIGSVFT